MKWYVYILEASDKTLYTGITVDLERRLSQHNSKKGAKSLKGKLPVKLVYNETLPNQVEAAQREREIKGWKRKYKLLFIEEKKGSIRKTV